ncbi:hypothetical protein ACFWC0_16385 [Micromonospora chalcea]
MGNGLGESKLDGWNDPAEEAGTFPPKVIPVGDLYDYRTWATETRGWRKLEAAVNGGAAVFSEAGLQYAASRVNVASVVEAARAFQATQDLLIWLEQTLRTAVASMVGDEKAWKGPAASAFRDKMNFYADLLGKQAEHLAGGKVPDSTTAANAINSSPNLTSLPSQLYDAANHLSWAQQTIAYLDGAWATIASQNGVGSGSGPVPISGTEYEKPMAQQMAEVVHTVAEQYRITTDKAKTAGVTMPTTGISMPTTSPFPTQNITTMNLSAPPTLTPPVFTTPPIGGITTAPFTAPPNITVPTITPPNLSGIGGPGPGQGPGNLTPPSFSGPGEIGGPTPGGGGAGGGLPGFDAPVFNGPGGIGAGGGGLGGGGVPGGLPAVVPPGIKPPGSANLGGGSAGGGSVKPPSFSGPGEVGGPKLGGGVGGGTAGGGFTSPGVPGLGSPGGVGNGAGGSPGLPEKPDANGLLGNGKDFTPGAISGVDIPAAPGGAVPGGGGFQSPMMPGMPGAGAPGAGGGGAPGAPEAPDAKGLVQGDAADWQSPGFDGVLVPGAPAGVSSGGAGLGAPMPAMPGMPGPAGGANGSGATESPDARGLVSGDADDWRPAVDAGVPDGSGGAPAGGDGLGGVDGPQLPPGVGIDSPVATTPAGMPMMPGAPGAPGAGTPGGGAPDAPDASGLIEADPGDWSPPAPDTGAPYAPSGAGAGGTGLETPVRSAPDVPPPVAGDSSTGGVAVPEAAVLPGGTETTPVGIGALPPLPGPPGGQATAPPARPDTSGPVRPDGVDRTPSGPGDGSPDADGAAADCGTAPGGSTPDGDVSGPAPEPTPVVRPDADVPDAVAENPAAPAGPPAVPDVAVGEPRDTDGVEPPGASVPEVVAPPTAAELPTVVDLSPAAPVIVGRPAPAGSGPLTGPGNAPSPATPGSPPTPTTQPVPPNPPGQAGQPGQAGAAGPDEARRRTGVAVPVVDVETVVLPGALGLAAVGVGVAGRNPQAGGAATPSTDPDDPARAGALRRRSARDGDREPADGADSTVELREDDAVWGGDGDTRHRPADDHVPLVRPDEDPDDKAGWDDLSDADWLTGAPADQGPER